MEGLMGRKFWMRVAEHLEPEITQYRTMQSNALEANDVALHVALIDCYDKYADESVQVAELRRWLRLVRGENPDRVHDEAGQGYMGDLG